MIASWVSFGDLEDVVDAELTGGLDSELGFELDFGLDFEDSETLDTGTEAPDWMVQALK